MAKAAIAGSAAGLTGLAALIAASALTAPSEGFAAKPYWDPAHIRSYCFGETEHVEERAYTKQECEILLEQRMVRDYAPPIEHCAPELLEEKRVKIYAALLDASYNAGAGAVCSSPMVAKIHAGLPFLAACQAFTARTPVGPIVAHGWFVTARYRGKPAPAAAMLHAGWHWWAARRSWIKELPGLVTRRSNEAKLCLEGALA